MCGADPGDGAVDPEARDNQSVKKWRGMVGEIAQREEEIGGKTRVIAGMRRIRVGDYRVIYEVDEGVLLVLVVRIVNRREVYR